VRIVRDVNQPAELRALALRMTPSDLGDFSGPQIAALLESDSDELRREAVRALAVSSRDDRFERLAVIAKNRSAPDALRADAIAGLAIDAEANEEALRSIASGEGFIAEQRAAALRRLEGSSEATDIAQHPAVEDIDAWMNLVGEKGDAEAGWRVFFTASGVRCAQCHRVGGRGANTGPDLTGIVARTSRRDVLQSILQPSRAMAPMFVPTIMQTGDGKVLTGLWHGFDSDGKRERFQAADGTTFEIDPANVDVRRQSDVSIMPDGLHQALTLDDIRNLMALLNAE
jgi:putative heme-binding domain-containing protein